MVSFSVGMTFIFGGISVGLYSNKTVWFFGIIGALIDLGEEIAADAMDMRGDTVIDSNSLAIKYGKQAALKISSYIFFSVILLTVLPFLFHWFPVMYLVPMLIMDCSIAYSTLRLLKSQREEGRSYIRLLYLGATLGLLIFLGMRLIGI